jgi:hypothetical protein
MNRALRFRIITLQVLLFLVFGFCAGCLCWGSSFVTGMIHDQLAAQKISFPARDSAAIKALPAQDAAAMDRYAGQQLTTGDQAQVYADNFIAVHLTEVAGGETYSQVSTAAQADPQNAKLAAQANTLFKGEMLRSTLLNAWGWSQVGMYALFAAIGLTVATAAVLVALVLEVSLALRAGTESVVRRQRQPQPIPVRPDAVPGTVTK